MQKLHHTLKRDLTKTILLWSAAFFAILSIVFFLSFHQLELYIMQVVADHRLDYQSQEFAKHLDEKDNHSIQEESDALTQDNMISALILIDTSGELVSASLSKLNAPSFTLTNPVSIHGLQRLIADDHHLYLFSRAIPGHNATLAIVMDDRDIEVAILSATGWTGLLLLCLLFLSIKALHSSLRRHLIVPVERLRDAMHQEHIDNTIIDRLKQDLPTETSDILTVFDHMQKAHTDIRAHIGDMMAAMPSCFWSSLDGNHYTGISGKCLEIVNVDSEELTGQPLWSWTGSQHQQIVNMRQLQHAIEHNHPRLDFAYQLGDDKQPHWYGESITLSYDVEGTLEGIYGIINDISTRKHSQIQQAEALEVKHRLQATATLVGGIAHEFNNALAGMNGNLFLIKQTIDDDQSRLRITRIEQLIDRSASMIDRMLSFSRQSTAHPVIINVSDFLQSLRNSMSLSLPATIKLQLDIDPALVTDSELQPVILADEKKLQEVLLQLVDNARLALADSHAPTISMRLDYMDADDQFLSSHPCLSSRQLLHLSINDNGCGIPDDIQKRVFEPFFTTRDVGQGTGLGLSMAHGYIHQIGGDIDFKSDSSGTTFHVYLPVIANLEREVATEAHVTGHGETVLLVDDDKMVRESTCSILTSMGYHTLLATTGEQGVEVFKNHQHEIKLIFMDIVMPGINGIEASRRIRKLAPTVPIIFITGYDRTRPLEADVYAENTDLINKPFHISELSQSIRNILHIPA